MTSQLRLQTIRVLVADSDVLVCEGVAAVIGSKDDLLVVALTATAADSIDKAARHKPDVAVIDADLAVGPGIDVCDRIKAMSPHTRCIVHATTAFIGDQTRGADAVVLKQLFGDGLANTIRHIAQPDSF